jgi:hypothetical protein
MIGVAPAPGHTQQHAHTKHVGHAPSNPQLYRSGRINDAVGTDPAKTTAHPATARKIQQSLSVLTQPAGVFGGTNPLQRHRGLLVQINICLAALALAGVRGLKSATRQQSSKAASLSSTHYGAC